MFLSVFYGVYFVKKIYDNNSSTFLRIMEKVSFKKRTYYEIFFLTWLMMPISLLVFLLLNLPTLAVIAGALFMIQLIIFIQIQKRLLH